MQPNAVDDRPLAFRSTLAPFGTYANPDGSESVGFAWPGAVTEPLNALQRLAENSRLEDGRIGIPNPQHPGNREDMVTALLSIYGGNALNPAAAIPKNSVGMFAGRMAKTADNAPMGSAVAGTAETQPVRAYHGTMSDISGSFQPSPYGDIGPGFYAAYDTSRLLGSKTASQYAGSDGRFGLDGGRVYPIDVSGRFANEADWSNALATYKDAGLAEVEAQKMAQNDLANLGFTGVKRDATGELNTWTPGTVRSATTGETLFSDTGRPSILGALSQPETEYPSYWFRY